MNVKQMQRMAWIMILALGAMMYGAMSHGEESYWTYTVRPGDNIWNLSERYTTSVLHWKKLQRLNQIPDGPDRRIKPGTRLRFPLSILKHQPASASIERLHGQAKLIRSDGSEQVATIGMNLQSGDRISTQAQSNLLIRFADGSELLVAAESDVTMDSLSAFGETGMVDTRIRLQGGQVDTQVKPQRGPGSRYEIITPAAVAAVRGTDFRVSVETGEAIARSEVLEGKVGVKGGSAERLVPAGFGLVAKAGEAPPPPRKLLPAPDLSDVEALQQRLPLSFQWQASPDAKGYRFQISPDAGFKQLLADDTTPTHRAFWKDLPDGEYQLRVRAIDDSGLEGFNAIQAFVVDARPEPPTLIGLVDGKMIRDAQPEFAWSTPVDAKRYRFQLAADAKFEQMLVDNGDLEGSRFVPASPLKPGVYHWRLATVDAAGEQGPFSDVQSFEYKAIPDSPQIEAPAVDKNAMTFRWKSAGEGLKYQFQLAEDEHFSTLLLDQTVNEPGVQISRPPSRRYYFRVRAIDETGYAGPFGTTQQIEVPPGSYWPLAVPLIFLLLV